MKTLVKKFVYVGVLIALFSSVNVMAQAAEVTVPQVGGSDKVAVGTGLISVAQDKMAEIRVKIEAVIVEDVSSRGVVTSVELPRGNDQKMVVNYRQTLAAN
ncbi:hypothetical protein [Teredinibacter franksiae]|jgi:hypothetical protein|uniref:hypothetical protein n=1 Tax=Teredinibacter franksiae TaxID=2761453 RepID=UPI00162A26C8|nr:hypothetical protein [Teredinibacter franksiae]